MAGDGLGLVSEWEALDFFFLPALFKSHQTIPYVPAMSGCQTEGCSQARVLESHSSTQHLHKEHVFCRVAWQSHGISRVRKLPCNVIAIDAGQERIISGAVIKGYSIHQKKGQHSSC